MLKFKPLIGIRAPPLTTLPLNKPGKLFSYWTCPPTPRHHSLLSLNSRLCESAKEKSRALLPRCRKWNVLTTTPLCSWWWAVGGTEQSDCGLALWPHSLWQPCWATAPLYWMWQSTSQQGKSSAPPETLWVNKANGVQFLPANEQETRALRWFTRGDLSGAAFCQLIKEKRK